jgi:hypothetical protein
MLITKEEIKKLREILINESRGWNYMLDPKKLEFNTEPEYFRHKRLLKENQKKLSVGIK